MKRIICLLAMIGTLSSTFGELQESPIESYSYGKFGSSLLIQNIGYGQRVHNIAECKGRDFSLNSNLVPVALTTGGLIALPSLKYATLYYSDPTPESRYFGVGFEALLPLVFSLDTKIIGGGFFPLPNIELTWGRERESGSFSQIGLNLLPAVFFVGGTGLALFGSSSRGGMIPISDKDVGVAAAAIAGSTMISYTISF